MPPTVHTIVLNWLDPQATAACLRALAAQTQPPAQTIIVHNGPDNADLTPIRAAGVPFRLLRPGRNLGFTGGVNLGLATALADGADLIWLLNSDAEPAPDALARLVARTAAEPRAGLVAPVIRNSSDGGNPDFWGGLIHPAPLHFSMSANQEDFAAWSRDTPDRIWLAGAALLVTRNLAEAIGGLDESLFAYWDDHDYSLRANAAGFRNILEPTAIVTHRAKPREDGAPTKPPYYYYYVARNHVLLLAKHGGLRANRRALAWLVARQFHTAHLLRADAATVGAIAAGIADGLAGRGGEYNPGRRPPLWAPATPALGAILGRTWLHTAGSPVRRQPDR